MDAIAIGFVILMCLGGGVVAWVADVWGYKIGKKKLSLWHIRPRHIARMFVVFAGILIPLIFFGLYYAVSSTFREWVTKGQSAIVDAQVKSQQLEKVTRDVLDAENLLKVTSNEKDQIDKEREKIGREMVQQKAKQAELKNQLKDLDSKISNLQGTIDGLRKQDKVLQQDKAKNQVELVKVQSDLKTSQDKLDTFQNQYKEAKKRLDETQLESLKLTNQNSALDTKNKELQTQIAEFQKQLPELTATIADLKASKTSAEAEVKAADEQVKEMQQRLATLKNSADQLIQGATAMRLAPITFQKDEEIARVAIAPKITVDEARTLYRGLIRKAKSIATERGAGSSQADPFSGSAGIILPNTNGEPMGEDQVENLVVQQFKNTKQEEVFILRSATNCFDVEAVPLKFEVHPDPIVFRKGEIVAETQYKPKSTDSEIRASLREFLRTFVKTKARSRKMIPIRNRDGESFGELGEDQYFEAFIRAKSISRNVRMVAVAQDDIRAGDPLNINLEFH